MTIPATVRSSALSTGEEGESPPLALSILIAVAVVVVVAAAVLGAVIFVFVRKHRAERKMETRAVSLRAVAVPGTWPAKAPGPVRDAPPTYREAMHRDASPEVKRTPSSERVRLDIL